MVAAGPTQLAVSCLIQLVVQTVQLAGIGQVPANQICQLLPLPFPAIPASQNHTLLHTLLPVHFGMCKLWSIRYVHRTRTKAVSCTEAV